MATIKIRYKRRSQTSQSAEKVASNDDLVTEILLRLPIRSVLHFKSVSKHWLSLITSPRFSHLYIPHPLPPSGLFLLIAPSFHKPQYDYKPEYEYVPFNSSERRPSKPPFRTLTFTTDYDGIRIIQSCNGLLFCCSSRYSVLKFYIYNPTTGQFTTLPPLPRKIHNTLSYSTVFAFDPSRSPHYKVVCVRSSKMGRNLYRHNKMYYQIVVYSSETGLWSVCGQPLTADDTNFRSGVYLNGAVHWTSFSNYTYYFKIDEERLETMPMPQVPNRYFSEHTCNGPSYFGGSRGHLHYVKTYGPHCTVFDVCEMEKDYSTWSVKYHVNLAEDPNVFPGPFRPPRDPVDRNRFRIQILTIVRGEREEDSFLVLGIPGMVIKYNLAEKTFKKLYDVAPGQASDGVFEGSNAFEFIESLSCV